MAKMSIRDIKQGQTVRVTREVEVSSVDVREGILYPKGGNGAKIRVALPRYNSYGDLMVYNVELVKDVVSRPATPLHWPPQAGDVWEDTNGDQYYATKSGGSDSVTFIQNDDLYLGPVFITCGNINHSILSYAGMKLCYRKGSSL